jgi:diguanylate cyclase (GGDEF)-like protein
MTRQHTDEKKASVLVVDDTPENINVLTELLRTDYKVHAAVNGPAALALVRKRPPDIVLLDVMMPGMSGYDVCRALKDDAPTRAIPVIFITAMNEIEDEKTGLDLGAVDYITKPFSPPLVLARIRNHLALQNQRRALEQEVQARTIELANANAALANEVVARNKAMERAEYLFNFDALTGLPNRHQFLQRLERLVERARGDGDGLAVIGIGLDRFHVIKTALGGAISDEMLLQTGQRLQKCLAANALLARTGGEEFATVLFLSRCAQEEEPQSLPTRLLSALAHPFELPNGKAEIRASAAYALFPGDGASASELLQHMEAALEHAKLGGGSRVERFDKELRNAAGAAYAMESRIRQALAERIFVPYYQPKLTISDGRIMGAEALIRWQLPDGSMVGPAQFIPIAERSDLIKGIDRFMLEEVCTHIAKWGQRHGNFRIAVNLSATAFQSDTLLADIRDILKRTGADARHLELEITEHALITDLNVAVARLQALRDLGVHIALDDFGTGYSSIGYLQRLPLDVLKVDQTFVRDIETDRNAAAIVKAIITMAKAMGLEVVAEGVETRAQLEFIAEQDRDALVQGWIYSPAVTVMRMEAFFSQGQMTPASADSA